MNLINKNRLTIKENKELTKLINKYNPTNNAFFVVDDDKTDFKRYNELMSKILYK